MSTLRHIKGDRWEVRVYDPTAKSRKRSRAFRAAGVADARRKAPAIEAKLRAEIAEAQASVGTVGDVVRRWLNGPKAATWSPTTRTRYRAIGRRIIADLGKHRADRLRAYEVDGWLQRLAASGLSGQTVAHHRAVLRAAMMQAERWGLIPSAAAVRNSTPPKVAERKIAPPTHAVVDLLMAEARPTLRAAALLASHGGLRRGEVMGLRWDDLAGDVLTVRRAVVHDGPKLVVKSTKSGRERSVTLSPLVLEALTALPTPRDGYIVADLHADGTGQTPRRPDWLTLAWRRHCAAHGAKGVRFHDLRHWHATVLLDRGVPLHVVQARLGHADVGTTVNIYGHADRDADRAAMLALPQGGEP